jgi:hypothetical protein
VVDVEVGRRGDLSELRQGWIRMLYLVLVFDPFFWLLVAENFHILAILFGTDVGVFYRIGSIAFNVKLVFHLEDVFVEDGAVYPLLVLFALDVLI